MEWGLATSIPYLSAAATGIFLNDAEFDGQPFILFYREDADGDREILMSVVQEETNPHALVYV